MLYPFLLKTRLIPLIIGMYTPEIEEIRSKSILKDGIPWTHYWGEMAKKTLVKRMTKGLYFHENNPINSIMDSDNAQFELDKQADDEQKTHENVNRAKILAKKIANSRH